MCRQLIILVMLSLLGACATLEPQRDRADESAVAPATDDVWAGSIDDGSNRLVPLNVGAEALQWRLRALRAATVSIDLQTFIWKGDSAGLALVREIVAAAERGVHVRILLDDSFLVHADEALQALSSHANISYRIYNPAAQRAGGAVLRQVENISDFARINHRMHNKLLVVDGRIAIIGGRNQADEYFGFHPEHNFRDFELMLIGPFLLQLEAAFDLYWNDPWTLPIEELLATDGSMDFVSIKAWLKDQARAHEGVAQSGEDQWSELFANSYPAKLQLLIDAPPDAGPDLDVPDQLAQGLLDRIDAVERDLVLVSAYFIPTEALTEVIARATARGVRVRILTNSLGSNNHVTAHAAYAAHRPALLAAGAELYEVRSDAASRSLYLEENFVFAQLGLHEKSALFDECCLFVGSANMDPRSLRLNTEMGLLIDSPSLNERVRSMLSVDFQPENAWRVVLDDDGEIEWIGADGSRSHHPPASFFLRLESWFFGLLPIEGQM